MRNSLRSMSLPWVLRLSALVQDVEAAFPTLQLSSAFSACLAIFPEDKVSSSGITSRPKLCIPGDQKEDWRTRTTTLYFNTIFFHLVVKMLETSCFTLELTRFRCMVVTVQWQSTGTSSPRFDSRWLPAFTLLVYYCAYGDTELVFVIPIDNPCWFRNCSSYGGYW